MFLEAWARLDQLLGGYPNQLYAFDPIGASIRRPAASRLMDARTIQEVQELRLIRNQVVHQVGDYKAALRLETGDRVKEITQELEQMLASPAVFPFACFERNQPF